MAITKERLPRARVSLEIEVDQERVEKHMDRAVARLSKQVRVPGFRPGKVPVSHLKRVYGKSVMAEVLQNAVTDANRKIVEDNKLRLAHEPKIDFPEDQAEIEKALEDCEQALKLDPQSAFALNGRGVARLKLGQFEAAGSDFQASLAIERRNPIALFGRGVIRGKLGAPDGARQDIEAAKALRPDIVEQFRRMAQLEGFTP